MIQFRKTIYSIILIILSNVVFAQSTASYEMSLVKVIHDKNNNEVSVLLHVKPLINDFKLIVSGKIEYSLGKKTFIKTLESDDNIEITVYGDNFSTKASDLYKLIENEISINTKDYVFVIKIKNNRVKNLSIGHIKYGLWESNNTKIRNEKLFMFSNDKIINLEK